MRMIDADAARTVIATVAEKGSPCAEMADAMIGWLDEQPTVGGWISAKDRLPEKTGDYLVFTRGGVIWPYFFTGGTWFNFDGYKTEDVTHWMPLPEPPKEVQDGQTD